MSSCQERPKSANPQRRLRTPGHKVTQQRRNSDSSNRMETQPEEPEPEEPEPEEETSAAISAPGGGRRATLLSNALTFECVQKASALRVLAKTWDRQRDVAAVASEQTPSEASPAPPHRRSSPPPRKLRPLNRDYSANLL